MEDTALPTLEDLPADTSAPADDVKPVRRRRTRGTGRAGSSPAGAAGTAPKADRKPRARKAPAVDTKHVSESVAGLHQLAGGLMLPAMGMHQTGAMLAGSGEQAGEIWAALAKRYPLVGKLFSAGGDGMLLVQLLMLYGPIVQAAMAERSGKSGAMAAPNLVDLSTLLGNEGAPPAHAGG